MMLFAFFFFFFSYVMALEPSIRIEDEKELVIVLGEGDLNTLLSAKLSQGPREIILLPKFRASLHNISLHIETGQFSVETGIKVEGEFLWNSFKKEIPASVIVKLRIINNRIELEIVDVQLTVNDIYKQLIDIALIKASLKLILVSIIDSVIEELIPSKDLVPFLKKETTNAVKRGLRDENLNLSPMIHNLFDLLYDRVELNLIETKVEFHLFFQSSSPRCLLH